MPVLLRKSTLSEVEAYDASVARAKEVGLDRRVPWDIRWHKPQWDVPSTSRKGVVYRVRLEDHKLHCACKAGRHPWCVHRAAVVMAIRDLRLPFAVDTPYDAPMSVETFRHAFSTGGGSSQLGVRRVALL